MHCLRDHAMPAKQAENIGNFQILRFWGRKHTPAHQSA